MKKSKTTEQFIKDAIAIHGDKYDYSLVVYKRNNVPVKIICPIHGVFEQRPDNHLMGKGCKECGKEKSNKSKKLTQEQFIERLKDLYGDKYDYSKTVYRGCFEKVIITCPKHGDVEVLPTVLYRSGCPRCGEDRTAKAHEKDLAHFIKRAKEAHGDYYDYSNAVYKGCETPIEIICPKHGSFWQLPTNHTRGEGCMLCRNERISNTKRKGFDQFVDEATELHCGRYKYPDDNYVDIHTPITIICPIHGEFKQSPNVHLRGGGCPKCKSSRGETMIRSWLNKNGIEYEEQKSFNKCRDKKELYFDFYIPSMSLCIEFQGIQHYESVSFDGGNTFTDIESQRRRDDIKRKFCSDNGIGLIEIRFDEDIYEKLSEVIK